MKRQILLILVPGALGLLLTGLLLWGLSPDIARTQAAAPAAPQQMLIWEEDFSQALPPDTYYITATTGSGLVESGYFKLTQDAPTQGGRIFYLTPTLMTEFSATFRLYLGSKDLDGADGAAFIFCPSYDYPQGLGGMLDASCPEGYFVAFDTFEDDGLGPDRVYLANESNRLESADVSNLENGGWHNAGVIFDQGTITVTLDGSNIIAGYSIPGYAPFNGYFGFSAATGLLHNEQRVDDIQVQAEYIVGYLDGHVYDAETMAPIEGAAVTGEHLGGGSWSADTDPSGYYSMTVATGTYTVTAEHPSYLTELTTGAEVLTDAVTTLDFYLTSKVAFDPSPLHVTLDWLTTHATSATLLNRQPWDYDFEFLEQLGGFVPSVMLVDDSVLLVDDDDNAPDVRSTYTAALDNLVGAGNYDIWDTNNSDNEPTVTDLAPYTMVIWFTGHEYGGYAGPGAAGEAALGTWLDGGNCLFISSQDYHYDRGTTPFMTSYLGVGSVSNDTGYYTSVTGQGSIYGGLGPYTLSYPFADYSDIVTPGASAELAFDGDNGNDAAINKDSGVYRTTFWGYPWEAISNALDREDAMLTTLNWCGFFDLLWFGQEPLTGTVPASTTVPGELAASMFFTATYEAGVEQPGDYYATLWVAGDPSLKVPVTMTVLLPGDMGKLVGSVTDNCTAEPLEGVHISIAGGDPITETWTDAEGAYSAWLFEDSYELVFSTTGYLPFTDTVDILAGQTTTLDVSLVPEHACIDVYPDEFEAWVLTGTLVYTHNHGLDIINDGGAPLNFWIGELPAMPTAGGGRGIESLSGSYVAFDPSVGGDDAHVPGTEQTFCFRAESYTDDSDDVIALWESFPTDWTVSNVYVQGTPTCDNGGTWDPFGWGNMGNPYEIFIVHPRYQSENDHCTATYCVDVTTGVGWGALVSWYWDGTESGSPPHHPCSDDGYTPGGFAACDEAVNPQAWIPSAFDIPWLWEEPVSGTVPALSATNADILFSAVVTDPLPLGTYTATLMVRNNDPVAPAPQLPVSMHVVEEFSDPAPAFESNAPLCLGETADFTNTSLEGLPPTAYYLWDFGDGITMTTTITETVTHTYAAAGIYPVTLTAHQVQTGVEVVYTDSIEVRPLPAADFTYTTNGLAVDFTNASANATSNQWDFGDGYGSTLENPSHTYASFGDYPVSLTVYGTCGLDQVEKTITVGFYHNYLPLVSRE